MDKTFKRLIASKNKEEKNGKTEEKMERRHNRKRTAQDRGR